MYDRAGLHRYMREAVRVSGDNPVLIDRGGRELPIQADIVGRAMTVGPDERVDVFVSELDGRDAVELVRGP